MKQLSIFRTTAFKMALVVAGFFVSLTAVLFAVVFLLLADYANSQTRNVVLIETDRLLQIAAAGGDDAASQFVRGRSAPEERDASYLLADVDGKILAGQLKFDLNGPEWQTILQPWDPKETLLAKRTSLPDGKAIVVAFPSGEENELKQAIMTSFLWAAVLTAALSLVGGLVLSRSFLRRVQTVTCATTLFSEGHLQERVPVRGTDDEFDKLAGSINQMLSQTEMLMESMSQVSSDIAHDLRTPLSRLRQGLDSAKRKSTDVPGLKAAIDRAISETDDILATFAALLRIAEIDGGTRRAEFRRVKLSLLVETISDAYAAVAEDSGQKVMLAADAEVYVEGDWDLLAQMLANLVENALRHSGSGAVVHISLTSRSKNDVVLRISDNGPGIPQIDREAVFRRFYRLDRSRTSGGHGLGLALVAAIARLHGISIELSDNRPGLAVTLRFSAVTSTVHDGV